MRLAEALARTGRRLEAAATYLEGVGIDATSDFELRRGAGYNFLRAGRIDDGLREVEALCREVGLGWPSGRVASFLAVVALRVRVAWRRYHSELSRTHPVEGIAARRMDLCLDLALGLRLSHRCTRPSSSRYTLLALATANRAGWLGRWHSKRERTPWPEAGAAGGRPRARTRSPGDR
jgi:hypothetical protein